MATVNCDFAIGGPAMGNLVATDGLPWFDTTGYVRMYNYLQDGILEQESLNRNWIFNNSFLKLSYFLSKNNCF